MYTKIARKKIITLNVIFGWVDLIENRDSVGTSFAGPVLGSGQNVAPALSNWD